MMNIEELIKKRTFASTAAVITQEESAYIKGLIGQIMSLFPCEYDEKAFEHLAALRGQVATLRGALNDLLRLADRSGLCPFGQKRCEMDAARAALAATAAPQDTEARHESK